MDVQGIGTLAVGLLSVVAGAGWLVGRHARRVGRLKGEAELWRMLDDGDAKNRLREHLDASVVEYVEDQGSISTWWVFGMVVGWFSTAAVLLFGALSILVSDDHEPPDAWGPIVIVPVAVMVLCAARMSLHDSGFVRRVRQATRRKA